MEGQDGLGKADTVNLPAPVSCPHFVTVPCLQQMQFLLGNGPELPGSVTCTKAVRSRRCCVGCSPSVTRVGEVAPGREERGLAVSLPSSPVG